METSSPNGRPVIGPPFPPSYQGLGGIPTILPDVPISAVFLALFVTGAAAHMAIFQINKKHGKKFILNAATFGFCMTRIIATSLRIAWATQPHNVALGMAANIFVYAGIPILFIANLFFAQRIVRAQHPRVGWSKPFSIWLPLLIAIMIAMIFCLIAAVIVQFYTYMPFPQHSSRDIQMVGQTLFAVCALLPLPIVAISSIARLHPHIRMTKTMDKFGSGSMRAKVAISLVSAVILSIGAWYRAGTFYLTPVPISEPLPSYYHKAAFYVVNFTLEISVVYGWLAVRIDRRFFVPNGAKGPYSYASGFVFAGEPGNEKTARRKARNAGSQQYMLGGNASEVNMGDDASRRTSSIVKSKKSWRSSTTPNNFSRMTSYASMRQSEDRISWGGIPRGSIGATYGEDGEELPYGRYDERVPRRPRSDVGDLERQNDEAGDIGLAMGHHPGEHDDVDIDDTEMPIMGGVDADNAQELGFDTKSGKWITRPLSTVSNAVREKRRLSAPPLPDAGE